MPVLFWEMGGDKEKGYNILRELSVFEKQKQKHRKTCFIFLLTVILPPLKNAL